MMNDKDALKALKSMYDQLDKFEEHIKYVYAGYGALSIGIILIIFGIIYYPLRKKKILSY